MLSPAPKQEEPCSETRWGLSSVESFGSAKGSELGQSQQHAWQQGRLHLLGLCKREHGQEIKGRDYLPLHSMPTCRVQFWTPQYRRNIKNLG